MDMAAALTFTKKYVVNKQAHVITVNLPLLEDISSIQLDVSDGALRLKDSLGVYAQTQVLFARVRVLAAASGARDPIGGWCAGEAEVSQRAQPRPTGRCWMCRRL